MELPVVVKVLGVLVTVHVPAGKLLSTTVPVGTKQVGWVIVPTTGFAGVTGCVLITRVPVTADVHPEALVTVNVYEPDVSPLTVVDAVFPLVVITPGLRTSVQVPDGKLFNTTEPVATVQLGCVIAPNVGKDGIGFGAAMPLPLELVQPLTEVVTV